MRSAHPLPTEAVDAADRFPVLDDPLNDLRVGDILALLAVRRCSSLSGAARERRVTPSQISKAMARLELQLHIQLLSRSGRGISFTAAGEQVLPQLAEVVTRLCHLRRSQQQPAQVLTIAGPSFLCAAFLPCLADCLRGLRVRGIEMAPAFLRTAAPDAQFDVALMLGRDRMPATWHYARIGEVRQALFAMPKLAARLGPTPVSPGALASIPFIQPVYDADGRMVPSEDGCPLHHTMRLPGHEVQTFALGLELAVNTEQLVFGPALAARRFVERGLLVEVPVRGWQVRTTMYVAHHGDRVKAGQQRSMVTALTARLRELNGPIEPWAQVSTAAGREPLRRAKPA